MCAKKGFYEKWPFRLKMYELKGCMATKMHSFSQLKPFYSYCYSKVVVNLLFAC